MLTFPIAVDISGVFGFEVYFAVEVGEQVGWRRGVVSCYSETGVADWRAVVIVWVLPLRL